MLEHTDFVTLHGEDKFFHHPQQAFEYINKQQLKESYTSYAND